ncbi:MAG: S-methyl-5'-thioadenosine phosphorylase [Elusimicrobia bacterium CG_4_10_14_3_um_filter_49_12_50_7]|nr:MAG: S-methyl-5'-thioadenosine phosphorylase [Elusimicrobia bacterium CG03_land_8_20_14_0_80_50_18]PIX16489.1 MAG: S-methyl-5'-thioadenosine phosphorylase [Elusimicrobia bacterium CG_4_8_14_3_um_filter_50_9]PIY17488.1 MAG: S-methyl-5'-thioadenosine phosphorylase [Elusimicrobia bacterium CG_4_10_14_3_um_filter_49_12_50_7]
MEKVKIAVIGGSGLYDLEGIVNVEEVEVSTPYGRPSDSIICGELDGVRVAFLPRHGRGHRILPSEVNSRANIYALKSIGVERIISVSACGSLKEENHPTDIVVPDQIFDNTKQRGRSTFFGEGVVAHVPLAEPFCGELSEILYKTVKETGARAHKGGTFVVIEGPRFSTKAESLFYRSMGAAVVGMTAMPEAFLAREAEICYATMAHVTDYDVWKEGEEVNTEKVMANFNKNIAKAKQILKNIIPRLAFERSCLCAEALRGAVMTDKKHISPAMRKKLGVIMDKYMPEEK